MENDNALTADDVAVLLRVGKNSVYRLAQSGAIGSYRIGRKLRFTRHDVENYVASQATGAAAGSDDGLPAAGSAAGAGVGATFVTAKAALPGDPRQGKRDAASERSLGVAPDAEATRVLPLAEAFRQTASPLVIAGNDLTGDIFANLLGSAEIPVVRSYVGSYTALINLYFQQADAALVHLYDRKTNTCNVPYVQRLAPGVPVMVVRLLERRQGLIVQRGNPARLTTWGGLLRQGVRLANRERGCGARVLLDEKLLAMEARPEDILGYEREFSSARALASFVAQGGADAGVGTERTSRLAKGLEFVPLQTEWLDIVVAKSTRTEQARRLIKNKAADPLFQQELETLTGCSAARMGAIVYEC